MSRLSPLRLAASLVFAIICFATTCFASTEKTPLRVGMILSLSGAWADFGQAQLNAVELAKREHSQLFHNIRFFIEDCQYRPASAVAAFQKLVNQDHVDIVFVWGVEPALALAPLAESRRIPLFVSALDPRAVAGRKFVIRTINAAADHSARIARYITEHGFRRVGIVQSDASFFQVLYEQLRQHLPKDVMLEAVANHLPVDVDFRTTIARLKSKKYDAVGAYLDPKQVPVFFRQAKEQSLSGPFFGTTTLQSRDSIRESSGGMEEAVFAHNYVDEAFRQRFVTAYGTDHQIPWAANAYDFAVLIGEEFGAIAETPSSEQIMSGINSISKRSGVGGPYHLSTTPTDRYFQYPVVMYRIRNGNYAPTETVPSDEPPA